MLDERSDAGWLPPVVASGLHGISRVARALMAPGTLDEVAARALEAMRATLELEIVVLYLPDPSGRPLLHRFMGCPGESAGAAHERIDFDEAAWELAVAGRHPLLFNEPAGWLVDNPFQPPASHWLVVPLVTGERLAAAVVASRAGAFELDPVSATVLRLLGEQLAAGIVNAHLRQELQQAAVERERLRVAAEVHDGLAQDLALAVRELAFLDGSPPAADARASQERLRMAVTGAHAVVRDRLVGLSASVPLGGLRAAVEDVCARFARRGLAVRLECGPFGVSVAPNVSAAVIRVLNEALANAAKHAAASHVAVRVGAEAGAIALVVADDGRGFDPQQASDAADGHFGLSLIGRSVAEVAGRVEIASRPEAGATVRAWFPL